MPFAFTNRFFSRGKEKRNPRFRSKHFRGGSRHDPWSRGNTGGTLKSLKFFGTSSSGSGATGMIMGRK